MVAGRAVNAIVLFSWLILDAIFLYYVDHIRRTGCVCAMGWKRTFMQVALIAFIASYLLMIIGWRASTRAMRVLIHSFLVILSVAFIAVTRSFINDIKRSDCACARTTVYSILNIINYLRIALLIIGFVVVVIGTTYIQDVIETDPKYRSRLRRVQGGGSATTVWDGRVHG
jgi:hypothetical protein